VNSKGRAPSIVLLAAVTAIAPVTFTIFPPSIVTVAADLGVSIATVQTTLAVYLFALAVAQPLYGPVSDRLGRRGPLLVGLALYVIGSAICGFSTSSGIMMVGRLFQAIGVCSGVVIGRAIVRDWFGERAPSVMALVAAVMAVAPSLGAMLGGVLNDWLGWRFVFALLGFYGLCLVLGTWLRMPETLPPAAAGMRLSVWRAWGRLLRHPVFLGQALCGALLFAGFYGFLAEGPYALNNLFGQSPSQVGLWFGLLPASFMTGAFLSTRLTRRFPATSVIQGGNIMGVAGVLLMPAAALTGVLDVYVTMLVVVLVSIAQGLSLPPSTAVAIGVEPALAGTASGLIGCIHMGFSGLATVLVGLLHNGTHWPMVLVLLVPTLLAPLAAWWAGKRTN